MSDRARSCSSVGSGSSNAGCGAVAYVSKPQRSPRCCRKSYSRGSDRVMASCRFRHLHCGWPIGRQVHADLVGVAPGLEGLHSSHAALGRVNASTTCVYFNAISCVRRLHFSAAPITSLNALPAVRTSSTTRAIAGGFDESARRRQPTPHARTYHRSTERARTRVARRGES